MEIQKEKALEEVPPLQRLREMRADLLETYGKAKSDLLSQLETVDNEIAKCTSYLEHQCTPENTQNTDEQHLDISSRPSLEEKRDDPAKLESHGQCEENEWYDEEPSEDESLNADSERTSDFSSDDVPLDAELVFLDHFL